MEEPASSLKGQWKGRSEEPVCEELARAQLWHSLQLFHRASRSTFLSMLTVACPSVRALSPGPVARAYG